MDVWNEYGDTPVGELPQDVIDRLAIEAVEDYLARRATLEETVRRSHDMWLDPRVLSSPAWALGYVASLLARNVVDPTGTTQRLVLGTMLAGVKR